MQVVTSVLHEKLHYVFTSVCVYFRIILFHVSYVIHYFFKVFRTHQIRHFTCVENVIEVFKETFFNNLCVTEKEHYTFSRFRLSPSHLKYFF